MDIPVSLVFSICQNRIEEKREKRCTDLEQG